jgi:hypothetical protein
VQAICSENNPADWVGEITHGLGHLPHIFWPRYWSSQIASHVSVQEQRLTKYTTRWHANCFYLRGGSVRRRPILAKGDGKKPAQKILSLVLKQKGAGK